MSNFKIGSNTFFFYFNCLLLLLVAGGFGANAIINRDGLPPITKTIIMHGVFMTCWYIVVVVQSGLIRSKNVSIHRRVGTFSLALAVGMVISGILVALSTYARRGDAAIVMANLVNIISFIILYTLALYYTRNPANHKRLMVFASLAMLLPALGRITQALQVNGFISLLMLILLVFVPLIHDRRTITKVHQMTTIGIVVIITGLAIIIGLGMSASWAGFLKSAIGS